MSGFLKLMSGEALPDSDPFKSFDLIILGDGDSVSFYRSSYMQDGSERYRDMVIVLRRDNSKLEREMEGNAYVMSESGKTVASRGTTNQA